MTQSLVSESHKSLCNSYEKYIDPTCLSSAAAGGAALVPEVCPGRPAPRDGAVAALQLEEDRDHLRRVRVEVEDGGAATQEL